VRKGRKKWKPDIMASSDDRKAENKYKNKKNTFDRKNKNKMLKFIEHTTM